MKVLCYFVLRYAAMARGNPPAHDRLCAYVETELAAWVQAEAKRRGYSTSSFVRIVLVWLREGLLHEPVAGGTLGGGNDHP